jgi:SAM-dependent methyltransferase
MPSAVAAPRDQNDILWDRIQVEQVEILAGSRARAHYLAQAVRAHGPVLNIGIGAGYLEQELVGWGTSVYTVDPSVRSVALLRQQLSLGEEFRVGRAEQLPFDDNFFGAVVVSEVLEHLDNDILAKALTEIKRVLRPGGFIIGTVPAREQLAAQTVACPNCDCQFHRWGHYQRFDAESIRSLLAKNFSVDQSFERPFVCWQTLNWKGCITSAMKMALYYLGSHGSNENVIFRASKTIAGNSAADSSRARDLAAV